MRFTKAQAAGDLNVVAVGWNDNNATVVSVTDTSGNSYLRAIGPTAGAGLTQSIYYAIPIAAAAANANTVTVTFSQAANRRTASSSTVASIRRRPSMAALPPAATAAAARVVR